jgi:hypothetical protein
VTDSGGSIAAGDLEVLLRLRRSCETVRIAYPDARQLFTTLRDFPHRAV